MKKTYLVAEGVTEINGAAVPASRRVSLTDAEALYDLSYDNLTPAPPRKVAAKDVSK